MKSLIILCSVILFFTNIDCQTFDFSGADEVLSQAILNGSFPGCVALIASSEGVLHKVALGNYTFGIPPPLNNGKNPPMEIETLFDMASCSKIVGATTATAQFYQRGELDLETKVYTFLGDAFKQYGKGEISVLNLLLHNAGYPPDPDVNYNDPAFGCPETSKYSPQLNFSCQALVWESLMAQQLENPVGTTYVYSDLSMITLMFVIGTLAQQLKYVSPKDLIQSCAVDPSSPAVSQCYFEAYVRIYVAGAFSMKNTGFLPPVDNYPLCAPTENDTYYLHRVIQGQVSDGNAFAMGGIAGHAGIFSNIDDLYNLMNRYMFASPTDPYLNSTTTDFFTKEYNHSQSSRALGWNTNDPTVFDYGWGLLCGNMSANTFMHVGYTGTELCGDRDRQLITILLTNRVYPTDDNMKIEDVRRHWNSKVVEIFDHSQWYNEDKNVHK